MTKRSETGRSEVKHIRIIVDTYFAQPISLFKARSYERFQEVKSTPYEPCKVDRQLLCIPASTDANSPYRSHGECHFA